MFGDVRLMNRVGQMKRGHDPRHRRRTGSDRISSEAREACVAARAEDVPFHILNPALVLVPVGTGSDGRQPQRFGSRVLSERFIDPLASKRDVRILPGRKLHRRGQVEGVTGRCRRLIRNRRGAIRLGRLGGNGDFRRERGRLNDVARLLGIVPSDLHVERRAGGHGMRANRANLGRRCRRAAADEGQQTEDAQFSQHGDHEAASSLTRRQILLEIAHGIRSAG